MKQLGSGSPSLVRQGNTSLTTTNTKYKHNPFTDKGFTFNKDAKYESEVEFIKKANDEKAKRKGGFPRKPKVVKPEENKQQAIVLTGRKPMIDFKLAIIMVDRFNRPSNINQDIKAPDNECAANMAKGIVEQIASDFDKEAAKYKTKSEKVFGQKGNAAKRSKNEPDLRKKIIGFQILNTATGEMLSTVL